MTTTAPTPARRPGRLAAALRTLLTPDQPPVPTTPTGPVGPAVQPWPEGVIARYATAGGSHLDLTRHPDGGYSTKCYGCGTRNPRRGHPFPDPYTSDEGHTARDDANHHATECRAMPRPATR